MADRHGQAEAVAELFLQLVLPEAGATAIAAPGIGQDQQVLGRAMQRLADRRPPTGDHVHRELGRIGRGTDIDGTLIVGDVIDTVGHCPALGIGWEVMHIDGGGFQTPGGAGILEIADQLLLLGVDADGWPPRGGKRRGVGTGICSNWALRSGCRALASSFLAFTCRA